jgi:ankyrin repeat protein
MIVKQLLEQNSVDPDWENNDNETPLSCTVGDGPKTVRRVLQEPVDPNSKNKNGRTPLSWAAEKGHEAVVEQLLGSCRDHVESKDNEHGQTPLLWAAENGHETVIALLLKEADIEALNKRGRTALYLATKREHSAVTRLLVEDGTDPTGINANGKRKRRAKRPEGEAVKIRADKSLNKEAEWLLVDRGFNLEAKDNRERAALHRTTEWGNGTVMQQLLERNADVKARDDN